MSPKRTAASESHGPEPEAADAGLADLTYEQAREELAGIVRALEAGAGLEESLRLWERGEALAQVCQQRLDGALARIEARTAAAEDDAEPEG